MRFDYTHGKEPRYMVSVHREMTSDHMYHHYYQNALEMYEQAKLKEDKGTAISIYDLKNDVRKEFVKL